MNHGCLKLERRFFSNPLWLEDRAFSKAEAFLDLLQLAEPAPAHRIIRGAVVELQEGELVASVRYLADRWSWGKDKVTTFVRFLETRQCARRETRQGESVIILCNYKDYKTTPDSDPDSDPDMTKDSDPDTHQTVTRQQTGTKQPAKTKRKPAVPAQDADLFGTSTSDPKPAAEATEKNHVLPKGWERMTGVQRKQARVNVNSKLMNRIGRMLGRKEGTLWTIAEALALKTINPQPDEVDAMESYYLAEIDWDADYRRRDLITLLNNWTSELDRARIHQSNQ